MLPLQLRGCRRSLPGTTSHRLRSMKRCCGRDSGPPHRSRSLVSRIEPYSTMSIITAIDLIVLGSRSEVDLAFLQELLRDSTNARFVFPEGRAVNGGTIATTLITESYVDLVLTRETLATEGCRFDRVFVNVGVDNGRIEVLLFMDLKDSDQKNLRMAIESLRSWAVRFMRQYRFESLSCRIDDGGPDEEFFNETGVGPMYALL